MRDIRRKLRQTQILLKQVVTSYLSKLQGPGVPAGENEAQIALGVRSAVTVSQTEGEGPASFADEMNSDQFAANAELPADNSASNESNAAASQEAAKQAAQDQSQLQAQARSAYAQALSPTALG